MGISKRLCKHCGAHVEWSDLTRHADGHNKTLVDKIEAKTMFEMVKYLCSECGETAAVRTYKGFVCQCCSHVSKPYADLD